MNGWLRCCTDLSTKSNKNENTFFRYFHYVAVKNKKEAHYRLNRTSPTEWPFEFNLKPNPCSQLQNCNSKYF